MALVYEMHDNAGRLHAQQCSYVNGIKPGLADTCDGLVWWAGVLAKQPSITLENFLRLVVSEHGHGVVKSQWILDLLRGSFKSMPPQFRRGLMELMTPRHAYNFVAGYNASGLTDREKAILLRHAGAHVRDRGRCRSVLERLR